MRARGWGGAQSCLGLASQGGLHFSGQARGWSVFIAPRRLAARPEWVPGPSDAQAAGWILHPSQWKTSERRTASPETEIMSRGETQARVKGPHERPLGKNLLLSSLLCVHTTGTQNCPARSPSTNDPGGALPPGPPFPGLGPARCQWCFFLSPPSPEPRAPFEDSGHLRNQGGSSPFLNSGISDLQCRVYFRVKYSDSIIPDIPLCSSTGLKEKQIRAAHAFLDVRTRRESGSSKASLVVAGPVSGGPWGPLTPAARSSLARSDTVIRSL